jgi:glutamate synthase domain-containing protein 1
VSIINSIEDRLEKHSTENYSAQKTIPTGHGWKSLTTPRLLNDLAREIFMCGIVGIVADKAVAPLLVKSLTWLEYRGYDSCGVATLTAQGIELRKDVGGVTEVADRQSLAGTPGDIGIAHTRWATHGGVSRENATHTSVAMAILPSYIMELSRTITPSG